MHATKQVCSEGSVNKYGQHIRGCVEFTASFVGTLIFFVKFCISAIFLYCILEQILVSNYLVFVILYKLVGIYESFSSWLSITSALALVFNGILFAWWHDLIVQAGPASCPKCRARWAHGWKSWKLWELRKVRWILLCAFDCGFTGGLAPTLHWIVHDEENYHSLCLGICIQALDPLSSLPKLSHLSLLGNPVTKVKDYR